MSNPALVDGIQQHLREGASEEVIQKLVLEAGYSEAEFEEAYQEAVGNVSAPDMQVPAKEKKSIVVPALVLVGILALAAIAASAYMYRPWEPLIDLLIERAQTEGSIQIEEPIEENIEEPSEQEAEATAAVTACTLASDPEYSALRTALTINRQQQQTANDMIANPEVDSSSPEYAEASQQLNTLNAEYWSLQSQLAKFAIESPNVLDTILTTYCAPNAGVVASNVIPNTDRDAIYLLDQADPADLMCRLDTQQIAADVVHHALYALGFQAMVAGDLDRSIEIYTCSAEKYHNLNSMYGLAQIHYAGGQELIDTLRNQLFVNAVLRTDMPINLPEAYYWTTMLTKTADLLDPSYIDPDTAFGKEVMHVHNQLRASTEFSTEEHVRIEAEVENMLSARYPLR